MACNCNKQITEDQCTRLRRYNEDGRLFIYNIIDEELKIRHVPDGFSPVQIANTANWNEFFYISEHPCIQNKNYKPK